MTKVLQVILTMAIVLLNAQNTANRFFYELTYKPSKDSVQLEKEMMVLDIDQNRSLYQSYDKIQNDSLADAVFQEFSKIGQMPKLKKLGNKNALFMHRIFKTYPIHEVVYTGLIALDYFSYRENPNLNWKISDEKQKIGIYNTQKATTDFGGRKWIAWFTTEIPFQDGPYKFYGLPGLIVKIEDQGKNYSWELKGNRKTGDIQFESYMDKYISSVPNIVTKEKFLEKYDQYKKNPFAGIKETFAQHMPAGMQLPDEFFQSKEMREEERQLKKKYSVRNNSIEL